MKLIDILFDKNLIKSKSEGYRLLKQNAISWHNGKTFTENEDVGLVSGIIKIGKRRFLQIIGRFNAKYSEDKDNKYLKFTLNPQWENYG